MRTVNSRFWQSATIFVVVVGLIIFALSGYMQPALRTALQPVIGAQQWLSSRYLAIYEFVTVPRDVASLRTRNEQLESELAGLQTQIIELQQQLREAEVLYSLLDYQKKNPLAGQYVAATVIGRDPNPFMRYVFIDRGSDDGLRHGMPVITDQGLVGRVDAVTAAAARVQLITDAGMSINVRIEPERADAQISGSMTGEISLSIVSQEVNLQTGDLVLTSGLGGSYPADLLIGQIGTVRSQTNELFLSASVQPVVDFTTIQAVLVIVNFRPVDTSPLEPIQSP